MSLFRVQIPVPQISNGEFVTYLGIWLLLSTANTGSKRRDFWSPEPINPFEGAPFRCNSYMSYTRFEQITQSLKSFPKPAYQDKLFEIRELLFAFNALMVNIFVSGWVVCLDESMSPSPRSSSSQKAGDTILQTLEEDAQAASPTLPDGAITSLKMNASHLGKNPSTADKERVYKLRLVIRTDLRKDFRPHNYQMMER